MRIFIGIFCPSVVSNPYIVPLICQNVRKTLGSEIVLENTYRSGETKILNNLKAHEAKG